MDNQYLLSAGGKLFIFFSLAPAMILYILFQFSLILFHICQLHYLLR